MVRNHTSTIFFSNYWSYLCIFISNLFPVRDPPTPQVSFLCLEVKYLQGMNVCIEASNFY